MDMDSTAIQIECIDEIAKLAKFGEMVSEVTERAMRGELDFTASLLRQRWRRERCRCQYFALQVRESLPLMPGLAQLVLKLETLGWKVAIASSVHLLRQYHRATAIADVVANELEIMDGKLTGNVIGTVPVDAKYKAATLENWRKNMQSRRRRPWRSAMAPTILPIVAAAGLGIAYHAK